MLDDRPVSYIMENEMNRGPFTRQLNITNAVIFGLMAMPPRHRPTNWDNTRELVEKVCDVFNFVGDREAVSSKVWAWLSENL